MTISRIGVISAAAFAGLTIASPASSATRESLSSLSLPSFCRSRQPARSTRRRRTREPAKPFTPACRPAPFPIPDSHFKDVVFEDATWDFRTFDFDRDITRAERVDDGTLTAVNPDLSAFAKRGGKLLMYHGWSDQLITAQNSVNSYESVRSTIGAAQTDATMRLFMAPGMAHCAGGPGPNQAAWLATLEQWVERGVAPTRIEARAVNGAVVRARPLCVYPQVARYSGKGSTDEAANFTCGP